MSIIVYSFDKLVFDNEALFCFLLEESDPGQCFHSQHDNYRHVFVV